MNHPKLKYMEEVNHYASETTDVIEEYFKKVFGKDFIITNKQSDKIWNTLQEVLSDFSETGDYKHHN